MGDIIMTILMVVAFGAIMYFFMYRPQKKQEKEVNNMRNNLQVGDEITTIGGIIGKIVSLKDETVLIDAVKADYNRVFASVVGRDTELAELRQRIFELASLLG